MLFLGAEAGYRLPSEFLGSITAVQASKPLYKALEAAKASVTPQIEGDDYDAALILCGKHKGENEDRIAEALKRVKVGGLIVVAGGKDDGIQSLRKRVNQLAGAATACRISRHRLLVRPSGRCKRRHCQILQKTGSGRRPF